MENVIYLERILSEIEIHDPLHSRTLKDSFDRRQGKSFDHLRDIICDYFIQKKISAVQVAHDYLHMIRDMRREGVYFIKHDEYSCKSQKEAFDKCYSDLVVMSYYMNALMISQLLWVHHFDMLECFKRILREYGKGGDNERILDVGAGHGLFSKMIQEEMSKFQCIDIVDISEDSLEMSKMILGNEKINYYQSDITTYDSGVKYDVIILGEILEHLDEPFEVLSHIKTLLHDDGHMWITIPINAPAIDHISLFRSKEEVCNMIVEAGLEIVDLYVTQADSLTHLVGVLCEKK